MLKRLGLLAFILGGLVVVVWGAASWISPSTSCRGVEMGPGDTCEYSSLTNEKTGQVQRYEDRVAIARQQAPFAVIAGLAVTGFGVALARSELKGSATSDRR